MGFRLASNVVLDSSRDNPVRSHRHDPSKLCSMNYSAAARETWRHHDLGNAKNDYVALVRYATLAASSHNTQPWKFELKPGRIVILPDFSRRCPEVDPDDHHLYASLGCATENLLLAASAAGLNGHYAYDTSASIAHVDFE